MNDQYLRPGKILSAFGRLYPHAWQQVDEFRAKRKDLGDWPDWCFLPLAGTYAIVSKGKTLQSPNQAHHIGILGALATWRVSQGIYRFDPTTFDALWKTPITGDIPTEVLFHLPEWCVYIPTPDQTWQGATLNGFFAHLESDMKDRRTELRLVLDVTGAAGDELNVMPIHLGKGGVTGGVEAMLTEAGPAWQAQQSRLLVTVEIDIVHLASSLGTPIILLSSTTSHWFATPPGACATLRILLLSSRPTW